MATQSGGSPAILALGNGGDDQKKFKKLQLSIWGAGQKKNQRGKKIIKKPNRGNRGMAWTWGDEGVGKTRQGSERREERGERNEGNKRKNKIIIIIK